MIIAGGIRKFSSSFRRWKFYGDGRRGGSILVNDRRYYSGLIDNRSIDREQSIPKPSRKPFHKRRWTLNQDERDRLHQNHRSDSEIGVEQPPETRQIHRLLFNEDEDDSDRSIDRQRSADEWTTIRERVRTSLKDAERSMVNDSYHYRPMIDLSMDSNILQAMIIERKYRSGVSYSKYLLEMNLFNLGCVSPASRIVYEYFLQSRKENRGDRDQSSEQQQQIDHIASSIRDRIEHDFPPALRPTLIAQSMLALSCSNRYREAIDWQSRTPIIDRSIRSEYAMMTMPTIMRSFDCDRPEEGFELLRKYVDRFAASEIDDRIFDCVWRYLEKKSTKSSDQQSTENRRRLTALIDGFVRSVRGAVTFGSCMPEANVRILENVFKRLKNRYTTGLSKINNRGQCSRCKATLEKDGLTADEFRSMSTEIIDCFVTNQNVYQWSTPLEQKRFERVLKEQGPFDVIIDGLNVVHHRQQGMPRAQMYGEDRLQMLMDVLENVRSHSSRDIRRILILLRPYVKLDKYEKISAKMRRSAEIFYCKHDSVDDSYLLYGALFSGENCYFVSNDYLRSQNQQFSSKTSALFQKWRRLKQIHHYSDESAGIQKVVWPSEYAIRPQKSSQGDYHFPIKNDADRVGTKFNFRDHEDVMNWVCVRREI